MKKENLESVFILIAEKWVNFFKVTKKLTKRDKEIVMDFARWADSFIKGDWEKKEIHE